MTAPGELVAVRPAWYTWSIFNDTARSKSVVGMPMGQPGMLLLYEPPLIGLLLSVGTDTALLAVVGRRGSDFPQGRRDTLVVLNTMTHLFLPIAVDR